MGKLIAVGVGLFVCFMTFILSWYIVPEGYRGVITRNGAAVGVADVGLGFKTPFIDSVHDMSVQVLAEQFENIASYSKDIQQSNSVVVVQYRLAPESVLPMYKNVGQDYSSKLIYPALYRRYKETFGQFTAVDIVAQRNKIANMVADAMNADFAEYGIHIVSIQISNIDFNEAYEAAIEDAANKQAEVTKEKQELERIRVQAQQQVAQAEAAAAATRTTADATAYATQVNGEAAATAIRARGDALRDNPALVTLVAAEKWDGVLPSTFVPGSAIPFISVNQVPTVAP